MVRRSTHPRPLQPRMAPTTLTLKSQLDLLTSTFADRFQGIITRNAAHFRNIAPALTIVEP